MDLFVNSINTLRKSIKEGTISPPQLHQQLQEISDYIDIEESRIEQYKIEQEKEEDIEQNEGKLALIKQQTYDMRTLIGELQNETDWIKHGDPEIINKSKHIPLSSLFTTKLKKISQKVESYKSLYSEIKNSKERATLKYVIKTQEFNNALASFNQFLSANHNVYLKGASTRFTHINPNKPKPYKTA